MMRHYRFIVKLLLVLSLVSLASAQDWQWEQYAGDYRNPTGFPQFISGVGDFNGDGYDEMLYLRIDGITVYSYDDESEHPRWNQFEGVWSGNHNYFTILNAVNLDDDPADELIVFDAYQQGSPECFKLVSTEPWTFVQQDELLSYLPFDSLFSSAEGVLSIVSADFDGDNNIEAAFSHGVDGFLSYIELFEKRPDGLWYSDGSFSMEPWSGPTLFDGDFDGDGDMDLGVSAAFIDTPNFIVMLENTGEGIGEPVQISNFRSEQGGDIDHDGDWESIRANQPELWHRRFTEIVEWSGIGAISDSINMSAFSGQVFGNVAINSENFVAGFEPWTRDTPEGYSEQTFWRYYSDAGWQDLDIGIGVNDGKTLSLGWGDLNNDGLTDMLREVQQYYIQIVPIPFVEWEIRLNNGDETSDDFSVQTSTLDWLTDNPDTLLSCPQLGDFNQDGYADLFTIGQPTGEATRVFIYRTDIDHGMYLEPSWSDGLPSAVEKIYCSDIDNDGLPELLLLTDSWHVYFYRNCRWQDYSDILPDFESSDIGFADFDNDGNIDIFTDEDVWLSLSPSPASDKFILSPLSFRLSCFPNPFNPSTTIQFSLPDAGMVSLDVYNIQGQLVESLLDQPMTAGEHAIQFDGSNLPSGVYLANMKSNNHHQTQKLILLK
jgi:hypothetical protein